MTVIPGITRFVGWRKQLPVSVVDWIEQDLCRSCNDITHFRIEIKQEPFNSINLSSIAGWQSTIALTSPQYVLTFSDGSTFTTTDHPVSILIDGYQEIISVHLWLDRYIRQSSTENGFHNYLLPENAYSLVSCTLKRGENDPFCLCFCRKLVNDASIGENALVMAVKMGCLAMSYDVKQICTAAYNAYYEVRDR